MKASCVLLRWYKSFNVNYLGYPDRRHQVRSRPWTLLRVPNEIAERSRFIEIPLEPDITTIVGGNESGKSHLLGAIAKVITGSGIPDDRDNASAFDRTDLCHYASVRNKNADAWPHVGLEFCNVSDDEWKAIASAIGTSLPPRPSVQASDQRFTLVIAPSKDKELAFVFISPALEPIALTSSSLQNLRRVLPKVHFIKSDVAMRDSLPVDDLLAALGGSAPGIREYFTFQTAQKAASFLAGLTLTAGKEVPGETLEAIRTAIAEVNSPKRKTPDTNGSLTLEGKLFRQVLGIDVTTIELLANLPEESRSYADSLVSTWNDEIAKSLNLSRYWQQDDLFSLRINYKRGILYFELSDKTGAIYTFRERSSGLKYFLSYYVQAKALETAIISGDAIIMMDEPDSYLSIIGQKNLLSIFETLVGFATAKGHVQLLYTTHSPFLINRNFPRRLRLVRKGDAEEGTQFIDESRLRRYEPVRSALGIDCSQTLFMGSTNVLLEGPTDQYLLGELIRAFSKPENLHELIDLNSVTLVSAESAPSIQQVLKASQWGDEPIPATVVLLDDDVEGNKQKKMITGTFNAAKDKQGDKQRYPRLIDTEFVLLISDCLGQRVGDHQIVTSEDLVPAELWALGTESYLREWEPDLADEQITTACVSIKSKKGNGGNLLATKLALAEIADLAILQLDKMGISQAVIRILLEQIGQDNPPAWVAEAKVRITKICQKLSERLELGRMAQRRLTGKQTLTRLTRDFLIQHPRAAALFELEVYLLRVSREGDVLGADGASLKKYVAKLLDEITGLRSQNQDRFEAAVWQKWKANLEAIRENPLDPATFFSKDEPSNTSALDEKIASATLMPDNSKAAEGQSPPTGAGDTETGA